MNYKIFIFTATGNAVLSPAIDSLAYVRGDLVIINNSEKEIERACKIIDSPVPLTYVQSFNYAIKLAKGWGLDFFITMHDDARLTSQTDIYRFIDYAKKQFASNPKLGWIGTNYDVLACWRLEMVSDVGEMDTFLPYYGGDCDYFIRVIKNGWECIDDEETRACITHIGSNTKKSNPEFALKLDIMQPFVLSYLNWKWGITEGWDKSNPTPYSVPFNGIQWEAKPPE